MIYQMAVGARSEQGFPNRPIRLITPEGGGSLELVARLIAQGISGSLGQPVIVENHEVDIGIELVAKAPPDGHTLLLHGPPFWTGPLMQDKPYDPLTDFSPVTLATTSPLIVSVHPSLAANSLKELIALAIAKPGTLRYGSGITGTSSHLGAELFKSMAGVDIVRVPYTGGGLAMPDLIAGRLHLMFTSAGSGMPYVKSGRVRALAVASAEPSALAPGLPTVAATLPGYEAAQIIGIFAPATTPLPVIQRLNEEIVRFLKTAETKDRLLDAGLEAVGSAPQELAVKVKSEMARLSKVIKDAGIRVE